ncbi:MAG: glycosyltransferase family 4 protein [Chloroflexi bacterium]|nr:glycosyltransferase family 4 protein [Chloroflexota bacterium]MBP8054524.1 glycosyltransferase family 4 protein [Chloroflexota bacterium]
MKIAYVGPFGFHPNKTMRIRALGLARALVAQGHTVRLFMPPWQTPAEANKTWIEDGVEIRYTPLQGGMPGITRTLIREVRAWQPDVIHTFKPKAYAGLVAWWGWYLGHVPLITDSDDWEGWGGWNEIAPYSQAQKYFFAWQERWGMTHHHGLTVASRALETIAWSMGVPPEKVLYLPNGSTLSNDISAAAARRASLNLTHHPTILLYSRLFEFDTGHLVNILHKVHQQIPDLRILAVGAGLYAQDTATFRQQLTSAGLQDRVIDTGWLTEAELPPVLACGDVGLYLMADTLLNRTKCPVKLADMLRVGLPVVGEAVGQVEEYIRPGETGYLVASGDADGLAARVISLLRDESLRQRFAAAARHHLNTHFDWPTLADKLLPFYQH